MTLHHMNNTHDLDAAFVASDTGPSWILQHSDWCDISADALFEFTSHAKAHDTNSHWVLTVQRTPALSKLLLARLHIEHATPQALLLFKRHVHWAATHWDITAETLDEGLVVIGGVRWV
jgi:bacillithiol system protein YtxJ